MNFTSTSRIEFMLEAVSERLDSLSARVDLLIKSVNSQILSDSQRMAEEAEKKVADERFESRMTKLKSMIENEVAKSKPIDVHSRGSGTVTFSDISGVE